MATKLDIQSYREKIARIGFFRHLTERQLDALLERSEMVAYASGEVIIRQGDAGDNLFAVIEGRVDVSVQESGKEDIFITRIEPGNVFGEAAIFVREPRTATVISAARTAVFRLPRQGLLAYMSAFPRAGIKILMTIVLSLIGKLKAANMELAYVKQTDTDPDDVDALISDFIRDV